MTPSSRAGAASGRASPISMPVTSTVHWRSVVDLTAQPGLAHVLGLAASLTVAVAAGRAEEAMAVADDALAAARAHGSPWLIAQALYGAGRAFNQADPDRALRDLTEGLAYTRAHRLALWEAIIAREAAGLEARPRRPRNGPGVVRRHDRLAVPGRQRRQPGCHGRQPGGALRPPRPTRDRRHDLRHQHPRTPVPRSSSASPRSWTISARRSATPCSTTASPPGLPWSPARRCGTPGRRSKPPAANSRPRHDHHPADRHGQLLVHRHRRLHTPLGAPSRRDAGRARTSRRHPPGRRSRPTAGSCSPPPATRSPRRSDAPVTRSAPPSMPSGRCRPSPGPTRRR